MSFERVLIVGLGETGRSLGMALKSVAKASRVLGYDRDSSATRVALETGATDLALDSLDSIDPTLGAAFLAAPATEAPQVIHRLIAALPPGAILSDLLPLMLPSMAVEREIRRLRHVLGEANGAARAELSTLLDEARRFQEELVR